MVKRVMKGVRIDTDIVEKLKTLADKDLRTVSDYSRIVIIKHIKERGIILEPAREQSNADNNWSADV